jgi:hypothetical protein
MFISKDDTDLIFVEIPVSNVFLTQYVFKKYLFKSDHFKVLKSNNVFLKKKSIKQTCYREFIKSKERILFLSKKTIKIVF